MADYGALVEYLLGIRKPGGGRLVRHGATITRIPQFPPNFTVTFTVFPRNNGYANIQYGFVISPHMVPNAFWLESRQYGILFSGGFLDEMGFRFNNLWIEITNANPIVTTVTNMTPLMQFFETTNVYLVIDSESAFVEVGRRIEEWGSMHFEDKLDRTNTLLESLGAREPTPQPPITARRL